MPQNSEDQDRLQIQPGLEDGGAPLNGGSYIPPPSPRSCGPTSPKHLQGTGAPRASAGLTLQRSVTGQAGPSPPHS